MIYITRRLAVNAEYVEKWLANKNILSHLFDINTLYTNSLMFEDDDPSQFIAEFLELDGVKYSEVALNSQGKKYIDSAMLLKAPFRVIFFRVGNRILFYGSKDDLGKVKDFVKTYMSIKEEENSLGDTGCNPIIRICKLSSKKNECTRNNVDIQEMNINEQDDNNPTEDGQTRTVSGFSEFTHNGKQSLNEDDEDKETKKKRRFIIKKKK